MLRLFAGFQEYTLCHRTETHERSAMFARASVDDVLAWLQAWRHHPDAQPVMRQALRLWADLPDAARLSDDEVLAALARAIVHGEIRLHDHRPLDAEQPALPGGELPPKPRPTPKPPRPLPPKPPSRKGNLRVEVVDEKGEPITEEVEITASGPESLKQRTKAGTHTFQEVEPGVYQVSVSAPQGLFEKDTGSATSTPVPVGGTGRALVPFKWLLNVVTPKIEVEYKVVLLDRGLSAHQPQGEAKLLTDNVTRVEVSATQSTGAPPYLGEGGSFEVSPANVEVFTDAQCQTPLAGKIPRAQLLQGPVPLFLRAKTAGQFTAKLTLDPSGNARVVVKPPATEAMGVVELKLTVHEQDIPEIEKRKVNPDTEPVTDYHAALEKEKLPDQKALSDADKIGKGRWLHAQRGEHHGRAKVVLAKLDAAQWPAGTDDYQITLVTVGGLAVHTAEEGNAPAAGSPLTVATLKAAEQVRWVEGSAAGKALRDARLELGLDRAGGGLSHTPKARGDWGCFTVVAVSEFKIDYTKGANEHAAWDEAQKRFYININRKGDPAGRKISFKAKLSAPLAGVPLRFMLAPDKDNGKTANWGIDFPTDGKSNGTDVKWKDTPAALKHLDKADRQDLFHLKAVTDAKGEAKVELTLSRWGGDKFHPGVYLEQDAHLTKYVHGHATLGKREPVFAAVTPVQVWRKVFYQVTCPKDTAMAAMGGFDTSQRKVFLEPLFTEEKTMTAANFTIDPYRPDWQFNPGGGDTPKLCIGTHNDAKAMALFVAETAATTPKFNVVVCDEQFDAQGVTTDICPFDFDAANNVAREVTLTSTAVRPHKLTLIDPPLQGGALVISATWQQLTWDGTNWVIGAQQPLPAAHVVVAKTRTAKNRVMLTPPAAGVMDATHVVRIRLHLRAADGPYLGWAPNGSVASVVKGGRPASSIQDVTAHEMGHLFAKARVDSLAGIPDHKFFYQQRGGSGSHCAFGATWTADPTAPALNPATPNERDAQGNGAGRYDDGECIMFGIGRDHKIEWCKHCALDFLYHDMSKFH